MELLTTPTFMKCRASSVLNRSADFQAKNMFVEDDSCWNSDGGCEQGQWLSFDYLGKTVVMRRLSIMFQGGFVGQDAIIEIKDCKDGEVGATINMDEIKRIEDSNELQQWDIPESLCCKGKFIKISFPTSTDFYGRVTIYRLEMWGDLEPP